VIPVDLTPKSERDTLDLRRELDLRRQSRDGRLGNRIQIALIENELDARAKGVPA
jgi:hypothetical protein